MMSKLNNSQSHIHILVLYNERILIKNVTDFKASVYTMTSHGGSVRIA